MNCPNDGARLKCSNTWAQDDGGVSRGYKCPTCNQNFVTTEYLRDKLPKGPALQGREKKIQSATFAKADAAKINDLVAERLEQIIAELRKR